MPDKTIFLVIVVNGDPNVRIDKNRPEIEYDFANYADDSLRSRCWGYHFNREDAEHVIVNNETDISELGYYQYAVLSEVGEGPLAIPEELQWYEFIWDWEVTPRADGVKIPTLIEVKKIEKPEKYQAYFFSMS